MFLSWYIFCFGFFFFFFFFNDTATTEIYTLSLHDALPISPVPNAAPAWWRSAMTHSTARSEEHTSELQSRQYLVCRLLLEKKKKKTNLTNKPTKNKAIKRKLSSQNHT